MVDTIRVSVAMTTYNGEKFILEQIDTILAQLGAGDELVISDDGSEDKTKDIIQEYQIKDSRVRLFQGPGRGVKKNVEHALRQCRGMYIFLADQDDIWADGKVDKVLDIFGRQEVSLVIHDAVVFSEDINKPVRDSFFAFRNAGAGVVKNMVKNSYIGCCMAFRRELLEKALPIPGTIEMHDQWIGILNDFYFKKSVFYRTPLLFYRRHGKNHSEMTRYGVGRMIKNRAALLFCLIGRILRNCLPKKA